MAAFRTRRDFLKASGIGLAGGALLAGNGAIPRPLHADAPTGRTDGARPTKIIFLVSDGMSMGVPGMTEQFSRMMRGKGTHLAAMMQDKAVAHGWFETYSLSGMVTDSAAASCSWASGVRLWNGAVNMNLDGEKLDPILQLAKAEGYGTGLVTTATVTHATPAGFAGNAPTRASEQDFAHQYLNVVDVIMGGGLTRFQPGHRDDGEDLIQKYKDAGYELSLHRSHALKAGSSAKLLGLYTPGYLPYTLDQMQSAEQMESVPTLAEMTETALAALDKASPKGFVVQIEGARVDHAAHANDAAALLWDQIAFDDAIGVALDYQRRHPETLVIVTSDHGNSSPSLGQYSIEADRSFARLAHAKASVIPIRNAMRERRNSDGRTPAGDVQDVVKELLGIELNREEAGAISDMTAGRIPHVFNASLHNFHSIFNAIIGNHNGVAWNCSVHTDEYTIIAAKGAGQDAFNGLIKNTDAFSIMTGYLGIEHENHAWTFDEAMAHWGA